mgnify:CR=1 FL=1
MEVVPSAIRTVPFLRVMVESFRNWIHCSPFRQSPLPGPQGIGVAAKINGKVLTRGHGNAGRLWDVLQDVDGVPGFGRCDRRTQGLIGLAAHHHRRRSQRTCPRPRQARPHGPFQRHDGYDQIEYQAILGGRLGGGDLSPERSLLPSPGILFPQSFMQNNVADYIRSLLASERFARQVTYHRVLPAREARYGETRARGPAPLRGCCASGGSRRCTAIRR